MNTIVANVLMNEAAKARTSRGTSSYQIVILFSCIGLFASLFMVSLGFDISGGPF
jgi:dolichol kinase